MFWLSFVACYEFIDCGGEVGHYYPLGIRPSGDGFKLAVDGLCCPVVCWRSFT
jgi:hypothetical protein